ncbi:general stress protein [Paenibacillus methanolicus]|uniref:Heat induced stress protein YflT n=1 Tax=Paenibacillus methanolicus TaxID=582686 RepID=A0A5S5BVY1_9BACL|nr:general stress protein [Paenibacillus methanolicus]TYP70310.1 heat induced stress protein YflT [Paenibacillus methanolicus]
MATNVTNATKVHTVSTMQEAKEQIHSFIAQGYAKDQLFVLAHDKDRTERLAEAMDTERIGLEEEGVMTAVANLFRSRGKELRAKMQSVGIRASEAERLEKELDQGKIVVIAWGGKPYENEDYDPLISYYPPFLL